MKSNCEIAGCKDCAYAFVQWRGVGDLQKAYLCQTHLKELWEKFGPLCSLYGYYFNIKNLEE